MSKQLPQDLLAFASRQAGTFQERFRAILDYAFREHTLFLNAKQLRELAGGGAQATAQAEIDALRERLQTSLRWTLPIEGAPQEVSDAAAKLLSDLWNYARSSAAAAFDQERQQATEAVEQSMAALEASRLQAQQLQQQLHQERNDHQQAIATQEQVFAGREAALQSELLQTKGRLQDAAQHLDRVTTKLAEQSQRAQELATQVVAQREASQQLARELAHQRELMERSIRDTAREAAQARDKQLLDHRTELRRQADQQEAAAARLREDLAVAQTLVERLRIELLDAQRETIRQGQAHAAQIEHLVSKLSQAEQRMAQSLGDTLQALRDASAQSARAATAAEDPMTGEPPQDAAHQSTQSSDEALAIAARTRRPRRR